MVEVCKTLKLYSGRSNLELAKRIATYCGVELGDIEIKTFANGEIYARYMESVRGCDVFIIQSVAGKVNDYLMEMLIMADAAKRASARTVTAVLTHYGYSRQDKKSAAREPITAKLVANLMTISGIDRTIAIDLHQGQVQGFFDTPVNHMTALPLFAEYFKKKDLKDVCVVTPDVGRAKAAKKLADLMEADLAIMSKTRPAHNQSEVTSVIGDVAGKTCIVNDDIIDTGGSVLNGARALKKAGAGDIYICATHGLFSGQAYELMEDDDIKEVVVCDTVAIPKKRRQGKIKVVSVDELIGQAVLNVFHEASISELFDPDFQI
ncbi:MAG: ribose-phosphate pyrophosphokinase [Coriobacteriales bacterium]|jgi:ribose-phosphate pyrophosphokinase|nr:ribose-phosphate pyrophosphokinase [Coriobacteriales bacterium]